MTPQIKKEITNALFRSRREEYEKLVYNNILFFTKEDWAFFLDMLSLCNKADLAFVIRLAPFFNEEAEKMLSDMPLRVRVRYAAVRNISCR